MNMNKNINQQIEICKNTYYNGIKIFQTSYLLLKKYMVNIFSDEIDLKHLRLVSDTILFNSLLCNFNLKRINYYTY